MEYLQKVTFRDLGLTRFQETWDLQQELNQELISDKRAAGDGVGRIPHTLLFCEHYPVYTLGKSGSETHLLYDEKTREAGGVEFFRINRGGDITFHGPGQIVAYPVFDLDRFFTDVHRYVRFLEEVVIRTLAVYGLNGIRMPDFTGVWLEPERGSFRKVCAIGVHMSRWVTMHGLALNVNTELSYFNGIVPCGIAEPDKSVTTMSRELGQALDISDVKQKLKTNFAGVFEFEYLESGKHQ